MKKSKKKLGSLLGNKEDTEHRKQLAIARMNKYEKMWIKTTKVKQEVKRDFYNKFIIPVLPYKQETWGMAKQKQEKSNTFHRKQLRKVIIKQYPDRISNKKIV